eukprot:3583378-Prymnesium_polylepis.1
MAMPVSRGGRGAARRGSASGRGAPPGPATATAAWLFAAGARARPHRRSSRSRAGRHDKLAFTRGVRDFVRISHLRAHVAIVSCCCVVRGWAFTGLGQKV